jgi:hypothetical protein
VTWALVSVDGIPIIELIPTASETFFSPDVDESCDVKCMGCTRPLIVRRGDIETPGHYMASCAVCGEIVGKVVKNPH